MSEQKPSIGRVVILKHASSKKPGEPLLSSPALVLRVHEDGETVDLVVFMVNKSTVFRDRVEKGNSLEQWNWPERV